MNMSRLWRESVFFLFLSVFGFSGCDKDIQMVSLGTLYCYDQDGFQKWGVRTGDIPAHMVFVNKEE